MSEETGIPRNYLSKVMHALVRARMVNSVRGPGGGFNIAVDPGGLSAYDVVQVFEDLASRRRCFIGNAQCDEEHACAAHAQWKGVWDNYEQFLKRTSIGQLAHRDDTRDGLGGLARS